VVPRSFVTGAVVVEASYTKPVWWGTWDSSAARSRRSAARSPTAVPPTFKVAILRGTSWKFTITDPIPCSNTQNKTNLAGKILDCHCEEGFREFLFVIIIARRRCVGRRLGVEAIHVHLRKDVYSFSILQPARALRVRREGADLRLPISRMR